MKTSELTGSALDWVVAQAADVEVRICHSNVYPHLVRLVKYGANYNPCTDWAMGGPIIEREGITWVWEGDLCDSKDRVYEATEWVTGNKQEGPTPLIAAMRCYCQSKLGDTVDIPDELIP